MCERDPKRAWRDALIIAWEPAECGSDYRNEESWAIASMLSYVPLVVMGFLSWVAGVRPSSASVFELVVGGLSLLIGYLAWANYTRPRLPTVWEYLVGLVIVLALPWLALVRAAVKWLRGFQDEDPTGAE